MDSTTRFSNRVSDYAKFRPDYPAPLLQYLRDRYSLGTSSIVADIGAGTGIFSRQLLELGCRVVAVEPNDPMREQADRDLSHQPGFRSQKGTAEDTGLPTGCVDLVTAAQAFHWFKPTQAARELSRVLREPKSAVLIWNERVETGDAFHEAYEALIIKYATDYLQIRHQNAATAHVLESFFEMKPDRVQFPHAQKVDLDGLKGRLYSSSYIPKGNSELDRSVTELFHRHEKNGFILLRYDTVAYAGLLPPFQG